MLPFTRGGVFTRLKFTPDAAHVSANCGTFTRGVIFMQCVKGPLANAELISICMWVTFFSFSFL